MIVNVNGTFHGQFSRMHLAEMRKASQEEKPQSNMFDFSVKIPTEPKTAGIEATEESNDFVFKPLDGDISLDELRTFDADRDGRIDVREYVKLLEETGKPPEEETTQSGSLDSEPVSLENFSDFLKSEYGDEFGLSEAAAKALFQKFDKNEDGVLSGNELEAMIMHITEEIERKIEKKIEQKSTLLNASYQQEAAMKAEESADPAISTANIARSDVVSRYEKANRIGDLETSQPEEKGESTWIA